MGLLDFLSNNDPQGAGQLAFGASMLDAGGPQSRPVSFGQALGQSIMGGRNAALLQDMNNRRNALADAQVLQALSQIADMQQKQQLLAAVARKMSGAGGAPIASAAPPMPSMGPMTAETAGTLGGQMRLGRLAGLQAAQAQPPAVPGLPQQQGGFPLDAQDVTMLKLGGMGDLTDMYKYMSTPQERKAGSFYDNPSTGRREFIPDVKQDSSGRTSVIQMGPDGNFRVAIPQGALDSYRQYAGAEQGIKNDNTMVEYTDPRTGQKMQMTQAQRLSMMGGGNAPQAPASAPAADFSRQEFMEYRGLLGRQMKGEQLSPQDAARMKALEARAEGQQPGNASPGLPSGPSAADEARFKNRTELNTLFNTKILPDALSSGDAAGQVLTSVAVARSALPSIGNGWAAPLQAAAAQFLTGTGMAPEAVQQVAANAEIFKQAGMTRLWEVLNAAKGPQTEGDATRAKATFAQLGNTKQANEFILDLMQAIAERDKMKASFYQKAIPVANERNGELHVIPLEWQQRVPSIFQMPTMQKWAK
jgi:hypothetical protein